MKTIRATILVLILAACGEPLIDKTDNSSFSSHLYCNYTVMLEPGEPYEIDDNASIDSAIEFPNGNVELCIVSADDTDDDIIEPSYAIDGVL